MRLIRQLLRPAIPAAAFVAIATVAPAASAAPPYEGEIVDDRADLHELINDVIGLSQSTLVSVDVSPFETGASPTIALPIDGVERLLDLETHSVRGIEYQLFEDDGSGTLIRHAPGPVNTLRGTVRDLEGATVRASILPAGLFGLVAMPDEERYWIEPVSTHVPGFDATLHVIYQTQHARQHDGQCGVEDRHRINLLADAPEHFGDPMQGEAAFCAQLGCDADYEYFLDWNSVQGVENRINSVINSMNNQYENEVDITHEITAIIVRSNPNDPYTTSNAGALLDQFRNEWLTNQGGIPRDVAHLFTGRNLSGSTIGVAWLSAVCTNLGYGLVESDFNGNFGCATDLSAHELGHNWGADHCSCSNTMSPSITCANNFNNSQTEPDIEAYRDAHAFCLDDCGPPPPGGYCAAGVGNTNLEHIVNVSLNDLDNSSGSDGYSDFTDMTATVEEGGQHTLTITLGSPSSLDIAAVWIDWNKDEDFDDALETISSSFSGVGPYTVTVFVPGNTLGTTRMRVRMQNGFNDPDLDPCGETVRGEVEDYTIEVVEDLPDPPCATDLDGSGDTGFSDLLSVLSAWGPCASCPQDLDGNGDVGFSDVLTVLSAWGPCP